MCWQILELHPPVESVAPEICHKHCYLIGTCAKKNGNFFQMMDPPAFCEPLVKKQLGDFFKQIQVILGLFKGVHPHIKSHKAVDTFHTSLKWGIFPIQLMLPYDDTLKLDLANYCNLRILWEKSFGFCKRFDKFHVCFQQNLLFKLHQGQAIPKWCI